MKKECQTKEGQPSNLNHIQMNSAMSLQRLEQKRDQLWDRHDELSGLRKKTVSIKKRDMYLHMENEVYNQILCITSQIEKLT